MFLIACLGWFVIVYAIPFSVVAAMPGWRSLAVATVVVTGLMVWPLLTVAERDDPFAVILYIPILAAISAAISRSVTFLLRGSRWARFNATIILIGLFLLPAAFFGRFLWGIWL